MKYKQSLINLFNNHSYTLIWDDWNTEFLTYVSKTIESVGYFYMNKD